MSLGLSTSLFCALWKSSYATSFSSVREARQLQQHKAVVDTQNHLFSGMQIKTEMRCTEPSLHSAPEEENQQFKCWLVDIGDLQRAAKLAGKMVYQVP